MSVSAKFKSLLRDQAFQNVLGLVALAIVIYGVGVGLANAKHSAVASACYTVAVGSCLIAGLGLVLLIAEHFKGYLTRVNIFRRFRLRWPLAILRDRPAAVPVESARTTWKGILWKWGVQGAARAYCPTHEAYALVFTDGNRTANQFLARLQGDSNRLKCAAGDGHFVELDGHELPTSMQFDAAALEAATRLRAGDSMHPSSSPMVNEVLYEDRPPAGKDFANEIASKRPLWVAIFAGTYIRNQMMLDEHSSIDRLLLVHPQGSFVEVLAKVTKQDVETLRTNIEATTRDAQKYQVPVRWFDGPFLNCVITDPRAPHSARVEVLVPFSATRPNVIPDPVRHGTLIKTIRDSFEAVWSDAVLPTSTFTPDEMLVILYNSYAQPAYDAVSRLVSDVLEKCFNMSRQREPGGAMAGMTAHYFKYRVFEPGSEHVIEVKDALAGKGSFQDEFRRFHEHYADLLVFVFQMKTAGIPFDSGLYAAALPLETAFSARMRELSGGVNREWLSLQLQSTSEKRELFVSLAAKPEAPR